MLIRHSLSKTMEVSWILQNISGLVSMFWFFADAGAWHSGNLSHRRADRFLAGNDIFPGRASGDIIYASLAMVTLGAAQIYVEFADYLDKIFRRGL